jgi:hypothetical protein
VKTVDGKEYEANTFVLSLGVDTTEVANSVGISVPLLPVKGYCLQGLNFFCICFFSFSFSFIFILYYFILVLQFH